MIINILNGKSSVFMRIFGLLKLFLKKFKKSVDIWSLVWYYI